MIYLVDKKKNLYNKNKILIDLEQDLDTVSKNMSPGSEVYVLETNRKYILNKNKEWINVSPINNYLLYSLDGHVLKDINNNYLLYKDEEDII